MPYYHMFGPFAPALPTNSVKSIDYSQDIYISSIQRREAEEYLDRSIMEGKFIPSISQLRKSIATKPTKKENIRVCEEKEKCWPSVLIAESEGQAVTLTEKVYIPIIPGHNFVGRILGPGGSTVRSLSEQTGCIIQVRGRGSLKNREREAQMRRIPGWEHLNEELHVVIQCEDKERRCREKMAKARHCVKALIHPMENDQVKVRQLMEVAILNGTFRPLPNQPIPPLTRPPPVNSRSSLVTLRFVD